MEKINVNLASLSGNVITILEGEANTPKEPNKLVIVGNIDSVNKYLVARKGSQQIAGNLQHIDRDLALITVDNDGMNIHLQVDPNNPFGTEVTGKMVMNPDLTQFQINAKKMFTRESLLELFKFNRRFFPVEGEADRLVKAYQRLQISTSTDVKAESDMRGNKDMAFKKAVDSQNIPTEFTLHLPIFKGQKDEKFRVEICLDATDASVRFWFESVELVELIDRRKKEIFQNELKDFLDFAIIWK
jgi:hypothetical protein